MKATLVINLLTTRSTPWNQFASTVKMASAMNCSTAPCHARMERLPMVKMTIWECARLTSVCPKNGNIPKVKRSPRFLSLFLSCWSSEPVAFCRIHTTCDTRMPTPHQPRPPSWKRKRTRRHLQRRKATTTRKALRRQPTLCTSGLID